MVTDVISYELISSSTTIIEALNTLKLFISPLILREYRRKDKRILSLSSDNYITLTTLYEITIYKLTQSGILFTDTGLCINPRSTNSIPSLLRKKIMLGCLLIGGTLTLLQQTMALLFIETEEQNSAVQLLLTCFIERRLIPIPNHLPIINDFLRFGSVNKVFNRITSMSIDEFASYILRGKIRRIPEKLLAYIETQRIQLNKFIVDESNAVIGNTTSGFKFQVEIQE